MSLLRTERVCQPEYSISQQCSIWTHFDKTMLLCPRQSYCMLFRKCDNRFSSASMRAKMTCLASPSKLCTTTMTREAGTLSCPVSKGWHCLRLKHLVQHLRFDMASTMTTLVLAVSHMVAGCWSYSLGRYTRNETSLRCFEPIEWLPDKSGHIFFLCLLDF